MTSCGALIMSTDLGDCIVTVEYWVNKMLPVEGLLAVDHSKGFRFNISIHLPSQINQTIEKSMVTLSNGGHSLITRELRPQESESILQKISCLKISFDQPSSRGALICPSTNYGLRIRRGTVLMEFSWADGEYITSDKALLDVLTSLVTEISSLESVARFESGLGIVRTFL